MAGRDSARGQQGHDALDHDEGSHVDVVRLPGVSEGHPNPDTNGRYGAENCHVEHSYQGPQLKQQGCLLFAKCCKKCANCHRIIFICTHVGCG